MRRTLPVVLAAALLGALIVNCSKADSSQHTGSSPPVNEPSTAAKGGTPGPTIPIDMAPADNGAGKDEFALEVVPDPAAGLEQSYSVRVKPAKGFHMNKDYPTKLTLELPAGVSSPKPVQVAEDAAAFTEQSLAFGVKLAAASKGDYTIPATLKFAVCTDSTCNPKKQQLSLNLKAQ